MSENRLQAHELTSFVRPAFRYEGPTWATEATSDRKAVCWQGARRLPGLRTDVPTLRKGVIAELGKGTGPYPPITLH